MASSLHMCTALFSLHLHTGGQDTILLTHTIDGPAITTGVWHLSIVHKSRIRQMLWKVHCMSKVGGAAIMSRDEQHELN